MMMIKQMKEELLVLAENLVYLSVPVLHNFSQVANYSIIQVAYPIQTQHIANCPCL